MMRMSDELTGAWLTPVPCPELGLTFCPPEFQYLLKRRLGLPLIQSPLPIHICTKCWDTMDVFGDHAVTCRKNHLHMRHQLVADALAKVLVSAWYRIDMEVAICGKERPADILIHHIDGRKPVAVDITVVHPLLRFDEASMANRID